MASVLDPFGAAADAAMPQLAVALDPDQAEAHLKRGLPRVAGEEALLRVRQITVLRHKPGKRCIVEYRVRVEKPDYKPYLVRIIGKTRAKRFGQSSYRLQQEFWDRGFSEESRDRISVPEPLGHIPELEMWFQRKVKAEVSTRLFLPATATDLARRVAEAAFKIHQAGVSTSKNHFIGDELRILQNCFDTVGSTDPQFKERLEKLSAACRDLGESLLNRPTCGIHRDFYSDQVILRKRRIYVIDFDLYCQGDPALDIGNFTAHLTEMALRLHGSSEALKHHEDAILETYLELGGKEHRPAIEAYHILTLARHIFLSTQFADRRQFTEPILTLCENQLYSRRTR
jgi:thiamine kinase-like enzyme